MLARVCMRVGGGRERDYNFYLLTHGIIISDEWMVGGCMNHHAVTLPCRQEKQKTNDPFGHSKLFQAHPSICSGPGMVQG